MYRRTLKTAYQAKVYREILNKGALKTNVDGITMTSEDFNYGFSTNETIDFKKKNFKMTSEPTESKELYNVGDIVTYTGKRLRTAPSTASQIVPTPSTDKFVIIGEPVYSEPSSSANHFVWYPVQTAGDGKKQSGYVASPSLQ